LNGTAQRSDCSGAGSRGSLAVPHCRKTLRNSSKRWLAKTDLGRTTHRRRTEVEARYRGLGSHRAKVSRLSPPSWFVRPALCYVRSEPRQSNRGLRLFRLSNRELPNPVRLRRYGNWFAADSALQCDRHPTAEWTTQQFREFLAFDHPYRFLIHDRDKIFS